MAVSANIIPELRENFLVLPVFVYGQLLEYILQGGRAKICPAPHIIRCRSVFIDSGKISRDLLGNPASSGPLGPPLESDDEPDALHGRRGNLPARVAENGVEDPSFSVADRHQDRLIPACSVLEG